VKHLKILKKIQPLPIHFQLNLNTNTECVKSLTVPCCMHTALSLLSTLHRIKNLVLKTVGLLNRYPAAYRPTYIGESHRMTYTPFRRTMHPTTNTYYILNILSFTIHQNSTRVRFHTDASVESEDRKLQSCRLK